MTEFRLIGLYILNRVGYIEFKEILDKVVGHITDEQYASEKWKAFNQNQLSFMINYKGFDEVVLKRIKKENYKG